MAQIKRLNHAVLYVSDVQKSVDFYTKAFGMDVIAERPGAAAFLRLKGSENHHDLGLFSVGPMARQPGQGTVGLYHLAWQLDTIDELAETANVLSELNALVGASDHGATKSLYGHDPDGNELEVMWMTPREAWDEDDADGTSTSEMVAPLDLAAELQRWAS